MTEIKSTMAMVLERAARMAAGDGQEHFSDEIVKDGMRLAAGFLRGETADLLPLLTALPPADQPAIRQGMATTLVRNILLPREEEHLAAAQQAMQGLLQLDQNDQGLVEICREITTILEQYQQHKTQLRGQLEQSIAQQAEQMRGTDPAGLSQKIQEEWLNMKMQLDDQYGKVLTQQKDLINQRFSS